MTEIINLRQQRKVKARTQKEKQATQNRLTHGQTKGEKLCKQREAERAALLLDGHRLEPEKK